MEPFQVTIDREKLLKELKCLEYPEYIETSEDFKYKLKVNAILLNIILTLSKDFRR